MHKTGILTELRHSIHFHINISFDKYRSIITIYRNRT